MAKSLESPTKLTEFAPLNPEAQPTASIRSTFARWFGINNNNTNNKTSPPTSSAGGQDPPSPLPSDTASIRDDASQSGESCVSSNPTYSEGRNLVSVLTRVSNLLAQNGMYSESEFKQFWMPDSVSKECYDCSYKFTALRRRHHCRICGQIFCSRCCHQQVPGKLMGHSGDLRACTYCCHIVLSCLQSTDPSSSADLAAIQEDLQKKLALLQPSGSNNSSADASGLFSSTTSAATADSSGSSKSRNMVLKRKISLSFQEERFASGASGSAVQLSSAERKVLLHDSMQLKTLHEELIHPVRGIQLQNHRYKLRSIANCCTGSEVVDWLLVRDKATSRIQATAIGQALVDALFLDCLSSTADQLIFVDGYSLFRPKSTISTTESLVPPLSTAEQQPVIQEDAASQPEDDPQEPLWVRQIGLQEDTGHYHSSRLGRDESSNSPRPSSLDVMDRKDHNGGQLHPPGIKRIEELSLSVDAAAICSPSVPQPEAFLTSSDNGDHKPFQAQNGMSNSNSPEARLLAELFEEHIQRLTKQLLSWQGLSLSWADVLMPLVQTLAHTVRPDVKDDDDDMDIRQYIHLKKVPGGSKSDSRIVNGVVCSKNVANRSMPKWSHDPNILLLSSAIDYQRVENKLISLEPLMMQENEYLKNAVAKIAAFKPEVLLVEKVVSGVAQEFLFNLGVTLVLNVKPSVMDRVSRCCQADIIPSIDATHQLSRPRLGSCRLFHVETMVLDRAGASKTLMFFDGCQPRLSATVLLRGAGHQELRKVKKIFRFMVFACYNGRLEQSFLADEFAIPKKLLGRAGELFEMDEAVPDAQSSPLRPEDNNTFDNSSLVIVDSESLMNTQPSNSTSLQPNEDSPIRHSHQELNSNESNSSNAVELLKPVRELDDPLHEYLRSRQQALGGDQSLSSTPIQEQQQYPMQQNISNISRMHSQTLATNSMLFRKAMEDTILSISPLLRHGPPYLETEAGRNAPLRKYLPEVLYYSQQLKQSESPPRKIRYNQEDSQSLANSELSSNAHTTVRESSPEKNTSPAYLHPFLRAQINPAMSKIEILTLLSDFRARGVRPGSKYRQDQQQGTGLSKLSLTTSDDWENIPDEEVQQGSGGGRKKDCLDPFNLQRLCVLFSSFCPSTAVAPHYCVAPWVVEMDFYGRNDIALGGFLERYCFHTNYACPSATCQSSMAAHVRRFVHDTASILVIIRQLANPVNCHASSTSTVGDERSILMWSWCKKCKQVSAISTMSSETWHFSFAKYLELRLYGHAYCRRQMHSGSSVASAPSCACTHPLHTEHFHYFGCRDLVASFKYSPIQLKEIILAQPAIAIGRETDLLDKLIEEVRVVAQVGLGLYAQIGDWLRALTADSPSSKLEASLAAMVEQQVEEKAHFRQRIAEVQLMLTSPNFQPVNSPGSGGEDYLWHIADHQVLLKRIIADAVSAWNVRLQEAIATKKKEDRSSATKPLQQRNSQSADPAMDALDVSTKPPPPIFTISPDTSREETSSTGGRKPSESHQSPPSLSSSPSNSKSPFLRHRSSSDFLTVSNGASPCIEPMTLDTTPVDQSIDIRRRSSVSNSEAGLAPEDISTTITKTPVTPSQSRLSLTALLAMSGGPGSAPLTSPFPPCEHHLLPPGSSIPLVVYQNEPSSIIAYALASVDYEHQLTELQAELADQALPADGVTGPSSPPRTSSPVGPDRWFEHVEREEPGGRGVVSTLTSSGPSGNSLSVPPTVPPPLPSSNHHIEIQFSDQSTKFYCRIYYAEQFRLLRSKIFPAGEERFIRSLARCAPWAASGGKSGSTFCKTLDDRFVLKQMSKMEIQSFIDLAPNYISYTQRAHRDNRPTAFCKILGAFRIVFKNAATNAASKQDLLVMENLFYQRKVSRKFDLKGSERNRLVSTSEAGTNNDCVLLDENFMKMIWDNPLYVRGYSQSVLNKALNADTQFLASQLVMDYSLLVGIDDETNQLIVGLIDYIRTFTWDKRLETFVKSSGILGGQGKMPTVVSPELYRTRFCDAMNRYFTAVPSFWD